MLKHFAANGKRWLSALPTVSPYIHKSIKFLASQAAPHIYEGYSKINVRLVGKKRAGIELN
jgi:hypothetical protein